jgi:hypothetical protein
VYQSRNGIEDDQEHLRGGQMIPQVGEAVEHLLFDFQTAAEPDGRLPEKIVFRPVHVDPAVFPIFPPPPAAIYSGNRRISQRIS